MAGGCVWKRSVFFGKKGLFVLELERWNDGAGQERNPLRGSSGGFIYTIGML
jgi:hypothetical protein